MNIEITFFLLDQTYLYDFIVVINKSCETFE